jgi:hypothetical protein
MADGGKVEEFSAGNLRRDLKNHDPGKEMSDLLCPQMPGLLTSSADNY